MSGTDPDTPPATPELVTRLLPPSRRREEPVWEILFDGTLVGFVRREALPGARNPFHRAVAYYPGTTHEVSLELGTDFAERCQAILAFRREPESSPHIGWQRPPRPGLPK